MALALDGKVGATSVDVSSVAASLTTSNAGDIIIAVVSFWSNNSSRNNTTGAPMVGTISSTNLPAGVWAQRSRLYLTSSVSSLPVIIEVWWAYAAAALTAESITAAFETPGSIDYSTLTLFGVSGADPVNPFDLNSALPAFSAHAGSGGSTAHAVTGISTTAANTFEIAIQANASTNYTLTADTNFTLIETENPASQSNCSTEYLTTPNSSPVSNATLDVFSGQGASVNYIAEVDAIQALVSPAWGGPTFVNSGGVNIVGSTATSNKPSLPANRTNGNLLLASCSVAANCVPTWSSGWTVIETWSINTTGAVYQTGTKAYCYVTGSETQPTITFNGTGAGMARVDQYTGVAQTNPIGNSEHNAGNGTAITCTAVTTSRANSLVANFIDAGGTEAPPVAPSFMPRTTRIYVPGTDAAIGCAVLSDQQVAASGGTSTSSSVTYPFTIEWLQFMTEILAPAPPSFHTTGQLVSPMIGR
jgi:hypothetical protein